MACTPSKQTLLGICSRALACATPAHWSVQLGRIECNRCKCNHPFGFFFLFHSVAVTVLVVLFTFSKKTCNFLSTAVAQWENKAPSEFQQVKRLLAFIYFYLSCEPTPDSICQLNMSMNDRDANSKCTCHVSRLTTVDDSFHFAFYGKIIINYYEFWLWVWGG